VAQPAALKWMENDSADATSPSLGVFIGTTLVSYNGQFKS
jgi:hypothetical protein